jgi:hypothetical protein
MEGVHAGVKLTPALCLDLGGNRLKSIDRVQAMS